MERCAPRVRYLGGTTVPENNLFHWYALGAEAAALPLPLISCMTAGMVTSKQNGQTASSFITLPIFKIEMIELSNEAPCVDVLGQPLFRLWRLCEDFGSPQCSKAPKGLSV
jgi:hypothetical protein